MGKKYKSNLSLLLSILLAMSFFTGCTDISPEPEQTVDDVQTIYYEEEYSAPLEVSAYLFEWHELPPNYITKNEAKKLGWVSGEGNLWDVTDEMSIGGDVFTNREGILPKGEQYRECDVNYEGGYRGAERLVYSIDDYDIYYTDDHYKTFSQMYDSEEGYVWEDYEDYYEAG